jgi:iron complex outermembrane receptor protein
MKKRLFCSLGVIATFGAVPSVLAQRAGLEEVVVTAQKRDQSQQDVPIAMDAFTQEDVENRQVKGVADLAVTIPSLRIGEAIGAQQISLRGVGYGLFSGAGENAVAVHMDGVYLANPGSVQMMQSDLAGVEVLRGPQGTLWGRNATGGVINFITPSPADEVGGQATVGIGNYDARRASGYVNLPVSEQVKARLSVDSLVRDGYIDNELSGKKIGGIEKLGGRLSIDIAPSDDLLIATRFFSSREDLDGPYFAVIDDSVLQSFAAFSPRYSQNPRKLYANYEPDQSSTLHGGSIRLDWEISDQWNLVSISGLVDYSRDQYYDNDGSSANTVLVIRDISDKTLSQEFNLSWAGDKTEVLMGLFFLKQQTDIKTSAPLNDTALLTGLHQLLFDFDETVESSAAFIDVTHQLTAKLSVFGGIRAMQETRDGSFSLALMADTGALPFLAFTQAGPGANPADFGLTTADLIAVQTGGFANYLTGASVPVSGCASPTVKNKSDDTSTTGRLGINYQLSENTMAYVQGATGYKSGGFASSGCDDPFEPEELDAYEVGIKSEFFGSTLRVNAAVYHYDYKNLQVEQGLGTQIVVENADAEIKGLDVDAQYLATDNLRLNAGLALIDAEYTKFSNVDSISQPSLVQDVSGNSLSRAPEWSMVMGGEYEWLLSGGASWVLRTDILFSDGYQTREFENPADAQSSYKNINAVLNYRAAEDKWQIGFWVKNLTDEEVLQNTVDVSVLAGSGAPGVRAGTYNLPRMFGADLSINF